MKVTAAMLFLTLMLCSQFSYADGDSSSQYVEGDITQQIQQQLQQDLGGGAGDENPRTLKKLGIKRIFAFVSKSMFFHVLIPVSRVSYHAGVDVGQLYFDPDEYTQVHWRKASRFKHRKEQPDFSTRQEYDDEFGDHHVIVPIGEMDEKASPRFYEEKDEYDQPIGPGFRPEYFNQNHYGLSIKELVKYAIYIAQYPKAVVEMFALAPATSTVGLFRAIKSLYKWKKHKRNGGKIHVWYVLNPPYLNVEDRLQF